MGWILCCLLKGNSMQQCIFQSLVFWGEFDWPGFSELTGVHKGKCINMQAHSFNPWAFKIWKKLAKEQKFVASSQNTFWHLHFGRTLFKNKINIFARTFCPNSWTSLQVFSTPLFRNFSLYFRSQGIVLWPKSRIVWWRTLLNNKVVRWKRYLRI